eukprot:m.231221 g.231221  ORF g.231221 m.231221 type:complete len:60 (-) comp33599_c1_seq6:301-480(-)
MERSTTCCGLPSPIPKRNCVDGGVCKNLGSKSGYDHTCCIVYEDFAKEKTTKGKECVVH